MLERLGAVYGWCWLKCSQGYSWRLLYWPAAGKVFYCCVLSRKPLVIRSGYMSRIRGLHWDRKRYR